MGAVLLDLLQRLTHRRQSRLGALGQGKVVEAEDCDILRYPPSRRAQRVGRGQDTVDLGVPFGEFRHGAPPALLREVAFGHSGLLALDAGRGQGVLLTQRPALRGVHVERPGDGGDRFAPLFQHVGDGTAGSAPGAGSWIRLQQGTPATALGIAGLPWGIDLSDRDAYGPLPKVDPVVTENDGSFGARRIADPRAIVAEWRTKAEAHGWSLRETVIALGAQRGHVGTPSALADKFARFVRHGAIDAFNVTPYLIPDGLDDIVDLLVPELQERRQAG